MVGRKCVIRRSNCTICGGQLKDIKLFLLCVILLSLYARYGEYVKEPSISWSRIVGIGLWSKWKMNETNAENDVASEKTGVKKTRRKRRQRPFPSCSFEEALELPNAIQEYSSGQPIRRLTLFDHLNKSPESSLSRQLIVNSGKYGLTKGGYAAEQIELTPDGDKATDAEVNTRERARARIRLAIEEVPAFKGLYDQFVGNKLPSKSVLIDAIRELDISDEYAEEAVDTFIVNLQFVGLLQTLSGAERILKVDHFLDTIPAGTPQRPIPVDQAATDLGTELITQEAASYETTCFYITAIGEEGTETRKHSDLFLGSIVEPALDSFNLEVIRADGIDKPGMITRQVIDYLLRSRLVIADLSFHNPNVFYELAIRHVMRLPTVQITRSEDRIPFDVHQARTIKIDCTDIYSLVPKIDTYRAEIANQVRRALEEPDAADNPITTYYPSFRASLVQQEGA